jgi:hypothetical protein
MHYSKHIKNVFLIYNVETAPIGTARHGTARRVLRL